MQYLIQRERESQSPLEPVNDRVEQHFSQPKERYIRNQSHREAMGRRMGRQPPTPIERGIRTRMFLLRHPVGLQNEITDEVRQHQQDQQIQSVDGARGRTTQ